MLPIHFSIESTCRITSVLPSSDKDVFIWNEALMKAIP